MVQNKFFWGRFLIPFCVSIAYLFLYLPILVLILFSFNSSSVSIAWTGFTLKWYIQLIRTPEIWAALQVSLIVAFCSTFASLILGTCLVVATRWWKSSAWTNMFYGNVILPEIILAVCVLSMFTFFRVPLGYFSLIVGHTILGLGFAVPIIKARYSELDPFLTEASLDLGATYLQTFVKIIFPLLKPSLIAAGLLVFTLSLDDFLIAFFCSSPSVQTLSVYVYSMIKTWVDPTINAISTCLLLFSSITVIFMCSFKIVDRVISHD